MLREFAGRLAEDVWTGGIGAAQCIIDVGKLIAHLQCFLANVPIFILESTIFRGFV